jgi:micrococcal nuclease
MNQSKPLARRSRSVASHLAVPTKACAALALLLAALCALILAVILPGAALAQAPFGNQGGGAVSIGGGAVYAGNGCAKAGSVVAGECGGAKASGKQDGSKHGASHSGSSGAKEEPSDTPSEEQYAKESTSEEVILEQTSPEATSGLPSETASQDDGGCASEGPEDKTVAADVERAVDGDTIELGEEVQGTDTVRMIGVDTPETVDPKGPPEPGGAEAFSFTAESLEGERVRLEIGEDPMDDYGRLLAYVWLDDGSLFEETLSRKGHGELLIIPPNDRYESCLSAAEDAARADNLGIWQQEDAAPDGTAPAEEPTELATTSKEPSASDNGEDGHEGFFQSLLGVGDSADSDAEAQSGNAFETTLLGSPELTDSEPAADQYGGGAGAQDPEVQYREVQEKEIQEPEVQEPEVQGPELQQTPAPQQDLEVRAPVRGSVPGSVPASVPGTVTPEVTTSVAPAAPVSALPETSGFVSLYKLALMVPALLAGSAVLTWFLLRRRTATTGAATDGDRTG